MKVFYSNDFEGHWPVGVSAIVVARDEQAARLVLEAKLAEHGLSGKQSDGGNLTLQELDTTREQAIVLQDGNY